MEAIPLIACLYISTWLMIVYRTFFIARYILIFRKEKLVTNRPILHFIAYSIGAFIITPFIWQVALFEEPRKNWVKGYCNAITGTKEK